MGLKKETKIEDLPADVVFDIICRLSIKEMIRFRSVSRTWNKLTKDARFVNFHLSKALSDSKETIILTPTMIWEDEEHPVYFTDVENGAFCKWEEVPMMIKWTSQMSVLKVFASCNGLLCLATVNYNTPIYIYNPITSECMKLPDQHLITMTSNIGFGLGFDPVSKKYKVVCAYEGVGEIITVGENSWRRLEFPFEVGCSDMEMLFVDGAFHWLINNDNPFGVEKILALDISNEKIYVVRSPCCNNSSYLVNMGNSLGLVVPEDNGLIHIWSVICSRNNHNGRCYQYTCEDVPKQIYRIYPYKLLGRSRSGSLVYHTSGKEPSLCLLNSQKSVSVRRVAQKTPQLKSSFTFYDAHFFVPTLFSPYCI